MKLVRFATKESGARTGVLLERRIVDLHKVCSEHLEHAPPGDMAALLGLGPRALTTIAKTLSRIERPKGVAVSAAKVLAPIVNPPKIICAWVNYPNPAIAKLPETPIFFSKFPSAIIAHEQKIVLPRIGSDIVVEPELTAIIGRAGKHISEAKALGHVAGYTISNDVTAFSHRLQVLLGSQGPYFMAKTFDTFLPCGPCLVTRDEVGDPHDLVVRQWLNGELKTTSHTSRAIFKLPQLISYVSDFFRLEPGDMILTGSPPPDGPLTFLSDGDRVTIEIEKLGMLSNKVGLERTA